MLYLLAYWQGLAKLRLHTESTLAILDNVTRSLGISLRAFKKDTCSAYKTRELSSEAASRSRREAKRQQKRRRPANPTTVPGESDHPTTDNTLESSDSTARKGKEKEVSHKVTEPIPSQFQHSRKPKEFNLNTYKLHSLGDYADIIRQYGTTDSYSTQLVSGALMLPQNGVNEYISRVKYHIEIQRFFICGLARSNSRNSLLRLKGGAQDFDASGNSF
jgi:hypothetical protein